MDPAIRKQKILEASKSVFAEKGYHDAGVADVIQKAGIARGTFYLYFKSKAEVFSSLIENIAQSVIERLEPVSFDDESIILETFKNNLESVKTYFGEDMEAAKILISELSALDDESKERLADLQDRLIFMLVDIVKEAQNRNILHANLDAEVLAHGFVGAIKGIFEAIMVTGKLQKNGASIAIDLLRVYMFGLVTSEFKEDALAELDKVSA